MESLPDEILVLILGDYLVPSDLIKCRLLSKRFKFLIDNCVNLKKLIVCSDLRWFRGSVLSKETGESMSYKSLLLLQHFPPSPSSSFPIVFAGLRTLELDTVHLTEVMLAALTALGRLEKLAIRRLILPSANLTLDLPNLKVFVLRDIYWVKMWLLEEKWFPKTKEAKLRKRKELEREKNRIVTKLIVNSRIERLCVHCHQSASIRLSHPEQLIYLHCEAAALDNQLGSLKNLKTLKLGVSCTPFPDILEGCESLERIILFCGLSYESSERCVCEEFTNHLLNRRSLLKRFKVEIYFNHILVTGTLEANQLLKYQTDMAHLDQLPAEGWWPDYCWPCYDTLVDSIDRHFESFQRSGTALNAHRFPTWFFERHPNIRLVDVSEIENESRFIWFLKHCDRLEQLTFHKPILTQSILDVLPELPVPFKLELSILGEKPEGRGPDDLNYGPVFRVGRLVSLYSPQIELDLQTIQEAFTRLRFLTEVVCSLNHRGILEYGNFKRTSSRFVEFLYNPIEVKNIEEKVISILEARYARLANRAPVPAPKLSL